MQDEANSLINSNSVLLAPNGNPSNLTPEQYKLVRTPEFKAWFGDWENDSENASKVVDENGEPLVVYHGTRGDFTIFDLSKGGESNTLAKAGFWFTPSSDFAFSFSENSWRGDKNKEVSVYSLFLNIRNPKVFITEDIKYGDSYQKFKTDIYKVAGQSDSDANIGGLGMALNNPSETITKYRHLLSENGFDGIIIKQTRFDSEQAGGLNDQFVALYPNQIKLADGTNTTFDGNNPDIRYADGGAVVPKDFFSTLIEHTNDYSLSNYGEKIVENSFAIMTTKADDSYSAKRVVAKTISGNDIDVSVSELYDVYLMGGKINPIKKDVKMKILKTPRYQLLAKNSDLNNLIKDKGIDPLNYSQEELQDLRNYYSENEVPQDLALKIWGLAINHGMSFKNSKVLIINSATGNLLNYTDDTFGHIDAINDNEDENDVARLLNHKRILEIHTDTSRTLNNYDLIIYNAKDGVDISYLKLINSKLNTNNLFIFVCPSGVLFSDNEVKSYINNHFVNLQLWMIVNESTNLVVTVLKKK